ncbi:YncE family protein [Nocardia shimofusensis]|uniref:YncE family protein n=1 Tax=Nocardia shimofusensis TaxID=228596 RepID=UPI000832E4AB|nr:YncE family protein [Nocardia shimofusensis]
MAVGDNPRSVAIDPGTDEAYVAHYADSTDDQSVSVIDTRTRAVTATIPVGRVFPDSPQSIAVDPATHLVYLVCGNSAGKLLVISPDSHTVTATIDVGGDPRAVVVDPVRSTVYVANRFSRTVTAVDTVTRAVVATIPLDGHPTGLAVDPTTHHLWVVSGADVSVIDPGTFTVSTTIRLGDDPQHIAIDPQQRTAYVTHYEGNSVSLINTDSRTRTGSVFLGERGHAYAAVVDPTVHTVYFTGGVFQIVTMIDTRTREVTAVRSSGITPSTRYGSQTWGAAVDPETHYLYVTNEDAGQIEVIAPQ